MDILIQSRSWNAKQLARVVALPTVVAGLSAGVILSFLPVDQLTSQAVLGAVLLLGVAHWVRSVLWVGVLVTPDGVTVRNVFRTVVIRFDSLDGLEITGAKGLSRPTLLIEYTDTCGKSCSVAALGIPDSLASDVADQLPADVADRLKASPGAEPPPS